MSFSVRKPIDEYRLISAKDPAIDPERSDLDSFQDGYVYDERHLAFRDGECPTVFHCRTLSHRLMARLLDRMLKGSEGGEVELSIHEAGLQAFRYGVYDMEGFPNWRGDRCIQRGNPSAIKETWLNESGLPIDVIVEIGSVILSKSRLSEDDRKN